MQSEINADSIRGVWHFVKGNREYQAVLVVMAVVLAGGLLRMLFGRLRIKNIRRLAESSGLSYKRYPGFAFRLRDLGPALLKLGDYSTEEHVLEDTAALPGACYLDYQYTAGHGPNRRGSSSYNFSLALFTSCELSLPAFELAPETLLGRAGDLLLKRDIDLPGLPVFSRRYALSGPDRERVASVFSPEVAAVFERLRGDWRVQADGGCVIAFKKGRISAGAYPEFIEEARAIFRAFRDDPRNKGASSNTAPAPRSPADAAAEAELARLLAGGAIGGEKLLQVILLILAIGFLMAVGYFLVRG